MNKKKAVILFGDGRQKYLSEYLDKKAFDTVHITNKEQLSEITEADTVIFPIPVTRDGENIYSADMQKISLDEIVSRIGDSQLVICASPEEELRKKITERGAELFDIMTDEAFVYKNACLTAQGALRLLLESTETSLTGERCLVIGFGRVGETLARMLKGVGCEVYVSARSPLQLTKAETMGCKTLTHTQMSRCTYLFDYIFGTVPHNILTARSVEMMRDDGVYFELASPPYTADRQLFSEYGKRYVMASALPGRFLPKSAAKAIADSVLRYIKRKE